jgi:hypothetical protein
LLGFIQCQLSICTKGHRANTVNQRPPHRPPITLARRLLLTICVCSIYTPMADMATFMSFRVGASNFLINMEMGAIWVHQFYFVDDEGRIGRFTVDHNNNEVLLLYIDEIALGGT